MSRILEKNVPLNVIRCNDCKNIIEGFKCKAFDLIPDDIISGENDHSQVIKGQKGDFVFDIVDNPRFM